MSNKTILFEIVRSDCAGPDSAINLNTSALFYRKRGGDWTPIDTRSEWKLISLIERLLELGDVDKLIIEKQKEAWEAAQKGGSDEQ